MTSMWVSKARTRMGLITKNKRGGVGIDKKDRQSDDQVKVNILRRSMSRRASQTKQVPSCHKALLMKQIEKNAVSPTMEDMEMKFLPDFCAVFPVKVIGDEDKHNNCTYTAEMLYEKYMKSHYLKKPPDRSSFFDVIFSKCANGREQCNERQFDLACAYVIICLLQNTAGLQTQTYWSAGTDELYCLISTSVSHIEFLAERFMYQLQLKDTIDEDYTAGFADFSRNDEMYSLFKQHKVQMQSGMVCGSIFRKVDRLKLLDMEINTHVNIPKMLNARLILGYFPISGNFDRRITLPKGRASSSHDIRNYCGEESALYFEWLNFYRDSLLSISFLGVIVFVLDYSNVFPSPTTSSVRSYTLMGFAGAVCIWGQVFVQKWKRHQAYTITHWGMSDFETGEQPRANFRGVEIESPIYGFMEKTESPAGVKYKWKGKPVLWYSPKLRARKVVVSNLVTVFGIAFVLGIIAGLFYFRVLFEESGESSSLTTPLLLGMVTSAQIVIMNAVYSNLAVVLSEWENWETQTQYKRSLTLKFVLFSFINTFNSFFYIAFAKGTVTGCTEACRFVQYNQPFNEEFCPLATTALAGFNGTWPQGQAFPDEYNQYQGDCAYELMVQVSVVFATQVTIGNFREVAFPLITHKLKEWLEARKMKSETAWRVTRTRVVPSPDSATAAATTARGFREVTLREREGEGDDKHSSGSSGELGAEQNLNRSSSKGHLTLAEKEYTKDEYDPFFDYGEMVIQLGFVTLFTAAMPLTPLFAYLNNRLESYVDKMQLIEMSRRPIPRGAENIGNWAYFIELTTNLAVVTNAALCAFMGHGTLEAELSQAIIFCMVVFTIKIVLASLIVELPVQVSELRARHKALNSVLARGKPTWDNTKDELASPVTNFTSSSHSEQMNKELKIQEKSTSFRARNLWARIWRGSSFV